MALQIRPLQDSFGAEVIGVDISGHCPDEQIAAVKQLWAEHKLLLFRDQFPSEAELVNFSRRLGPLEIHVRKEYLSPDNPEILYISNIKDNGRPIGILSENEVGWHYDQIYLPQPAVGSLLSSVKIPPDGGRTHFADMSAAYEQLSEEIKAKLADKRATQSYEAFNRAYSVPTDSEQKKKTADIDHPIIRTHPVTGRKALYLCPGMTTRILGMPEAESREMLDYLFDWIVRPEFVYSHSWRLGDCIMWDNACTMHKRDPFDQQHERLMKRTTILPPEALAVPF
jgi:taurine dioxygenase